MLTELLGWQLSLLTVTFCTTVTLIIFKRSWGQLPFLYCRLVELFQDSLQINKLLELDQNNNNGPMIMKRYATVKLQEQDQSHKSSDPLRAFDLSTELLTDGIEAILQDDINRGFELASEPRWTMLSPPPTRFDKYSVPLYLVYAVGLYFRWTFLLPLRICLLAFSVLWVSVGGTIAIVFGLKQETCFYIGSRFARLFSAATGIVATHNMRHNRPKSQGIAVANHLSANDVMTIYADSHDGECGYTATGLLHGGILYPVEKMGSTVTPCLFLDRACIRDRKKFQEKVINCSKQPDSYPVLLFPEGFCVNGDVLLQFRKAVFTGDVPIYPVVQKQKPRFGDSFWKEDTYLPYLLRILTSWALVMDIDYLPPMTMKPGERDQDFAKRVQTTMANHMGVDALPYDGGMKRTKDRERFRLKLEESLLAQLLE